MPIIEVDALTREFRVPLKKPGVAGALEGLFHREYQTVSAVQNISFSIELGELIGFIGPNGAGKTTTLKMLSGLLFPTSGRVEVLGFTPFERRPEFLRQIALVMGQKNQLWWDLPAIDSFLLNKEMYELSPAKFQRSLNQLVELMEVGDLMQTPVRKLSLGQRMKMELIAALLHEPKVLFLDEPTIGLDVVVQQNLREFIAEYNQKNESTILLTSHYMGDVRALCSRVIVINHGQVLFDGQLDSLIAKYAPKKRINVIVSQKVSREKLEKIADVESIDDTAIVFSVPRESAPKYAAKVLEKLDVLDLTIEEIPIESIIRDIFESGVA